jgi:hypothetical protein
LEINTNRNNAAIWQLNRTLQDFPKIIFSKTREHS